MAVSGFAGCTCLRPVSLPLRCCRNLSKPAAGLQVVLLPCSRTAIMLPERAQGKLEYAHTAITCCCDSEPSHSLLSLWIGLHVPPSADG